MLLGMLFLIHKIYIFVYVLPAFQCYMGPLVMLFCSIPTDQNIICEDLPSMLSEMCFISQ